MRRPERLSRWLLVAAAATVFLAARGPTTIRIPSFDAHAHQVTAAISGHIEAPFVQLRSAGDHQLRNDSDGRRFEAGLLVGVAALALAGLVSVIRGSRSRRTATVGQRGISARAPPLRRAS